MATEIYRRWKPPVPTNLGDVHGWLGDIHSTKEFLTRLLLELDKEPPDPVLLDALATAAVVRYSRCFTSGLRTRLSIDDLVPAPNAGEIGLHEHIRGVRDWHVAHPVNLQERHTLLVILEADPNASTGAIGFSSRSNSDLALHPPEIEAAVLLCDRWISSLTQRLIHENEQLIPVANQLSREALLALPEDELPTNPNPRARRKQGAQ
jgi:hypothetical protein